MRFRPHLSVDADHGHAQATVVLLHGGPEEGFGQARRLSAPYLRMLPFGQAVRQASGGRIAVVRLRHVHNGWNGRRQSTVAEAGWALNDILEHAPDAPIGLLGHSLGGRTALRVAGHAGVRSVVALAPWVPPGEPFDQVAGRDVLIVHGERDRICPIAETDAYVDAARAAGHPVGYERLPGAGHLMLRSASTWHRLAAEHLVATLLP